jgi:hypothetical protein
MKPSKQLSVTALVIICALWLSSCAHQPIPEAYDPPGFLMGLWNGLTIFFALIGHLFGLSAAIS